MRAYKVAESKAALYAEKACRLEENATAQEDFTAGYIAGITDNQEKLAFAIKQLKEIVQLGGANNEWYSVAIARYTLRKFGEE